MTNRFEAAMAKRSDKELIRILSVERNDYDPLAVEAADNELRKRNLDTAFIERVKAELGQVHRVQKETEAKDEIRFLRVIHLFVDTFLYCVLGFVLTIACMYIIPYETGEEAGLFEMLIFGMIFISFFLYYLGMELAFGRTVGKFITGTKVIMKDGSTPRFEDILRRTVFRLIPLNAVSFWFMKDGGFHDSFSDTTVVRKNEPVTVSANTPGSSSPVM